MSEPNSDDKRKAEMLTKLVDLAGKFWRWSDERNPDGTPNETLQAIAVERDTAWREVLEAFGLDPDLAWYPWFGPYADDSAIAMDWS